MLLRVCRRFPKTSFVASNYKISRGADISSRTMSLYSDAKKIYSAAIEAVSPSKLIPRALQFDPDRGLLSVGGGEYTLKRNVKVIAFGKAVLGMVTSLEQILGDHITEGVASIPVGSLETARKLFPHHMPQENSKIRIYEGAAHNLPNAAAEIAAREILTLAEKATADDLIIVLISGGGSALLPCPVEGVTLQEKRQVIEQLAEAGATIHELNTCRKSLSQTKGGKLAEAAYPAKLVALILSDVVRDPLDIIASGPTLPGKVSNAEVLHILEKFRLTEQIPASALTHLQAHDSHQQLSPSEDKHRKTPLVNGDEYSHVRNVIIGNNRVATEAAADTAHSLGYHSLVWSHQIQGEARLLGEAYATIMHELLEQTSPTIGSSSIREKLLQSQPFTELFARNPHLREDFLHLSGQLKELQLPLCLISAGEPIVVVKGTGIGGRNQELSLAYALKIHQLQEESSHPFHQSLFLSIGTDGQDGPCDAAGATVDTATVATANKEGLDVAESLDNNDSYTLFSRLSGGKHLIQTGLTGTNVMDLHILLLV